ncbi:MAG: hypothetical protein KC777_30130 [Cyanobacteria bacterium HKST-UBA02]|nr:hypothetical protein [Cyanobacteria bacterium HKST-UBA02]
MNIDTQIEDRISMIRSVFLKEGGWRAARALYLVGGFARGEGTADLHRGNLRIYNDVDLLAVAPRKTPSVLARLWRVARRLNDGRFDHAVDLELATADEIRRTPSSIREFDLRSGSRLLWGQDFLAGLPDSGAWSLRQGDLVQLLFNRLASLLFGLRESAIPVPRIPYLQVQISKPLLSMMAVTLGLEGRYVTDIEEQFHPLESAPGTKGTAPLRLLLGQPEVKGLLEAAVEFKRRPKPDHFLPYGSSLRIVAGSFHGFILRCLQDVYSAGEGCSAQAPVTAFRNRQPEGWRLFTRAWWVQSIRAVQAGLRPAPSGWGPHPEVDVYSALALWIDEHVRQEPTRWQKYARANRSEDPLEEIEILLKKWKSAAFDCRLR